MNRKDIPMIALLASLITPAACKAEQPQEAVTEDDNWTWVQDMYDRAKAAGEQVPANVYQWAKQDVAKIGDWEYLVREIAIAKAGKLEQQLNQLGAERWDCIWIHAEGGKTTLIFKRPARTYLNKISVNQLMKLVPGGDSGE